jgi:hypothetical protein
LKIKKKIENLSAYNFINQYLESCGIEDTDLYLNPTLECFENPFNYPNMEKAIQVFEKHTKENEKVGILMD